jgi:hypothetical protein
MDDLKPTPGLTAASVHLGARVIVRAPQGSAYDGREGTVRHATDTTAFVQLDRIATIPFGWGELVLASSVTRQA